MMAEYAMRPQPFFTMQQRGSNEFSTGQVLDVV
jgi:hypothetical protein